MTDHDMVVATHENVKFIKERIKSIDLTLGGHETRIDNLESWKDTTSIILKILALASLLGGAGGLGARAMGLI